MGWTLSSLTLRKYYEYVELYTDTHGFDVLIKQLQLPYSKAKVVFDDRTRYPKGLWALPKIKTYSLQEKPFIHVDGNIFIWESSIRIYTKRN